MESKKRERAANFTVAEVHLLVSLVEKHRDVIENKKTDAITNRDKDAAWKKIELSFNSCGSSTNIRTWKMLKLKYEGIKKNTKKKSAQRRQETYKTGGGPSNAPGFDEIEEKVLSICSNITGLEARNDSDAIFEPEPVPVEEIVHEYNTIDVLYNIEDNESREEKNQTEPVIFKIPDLNESIITVDNFSEDQESQKENKWEKWNPKVLKSKISKQLKEKVTKHSVTSKLDQLSSARLELVHLQMEFAREEHDLKMLHMRNDEKRRQEIHELLMKRMSCGPIPNDIEMSLGKL